MGCREEQGGNEAGHMGRRTVLTARGLRPTRRPDLRGEDRRRLSVASRLIPIDVLDKVQEMGERWQQGREVWGKRGRWPMADNDQEYLKK